VGFLGLSILLFSGTWREPLTSVASGGSPDVGIFIWFLRWVPFALGHMQNPLVTTYLDSPGGVNAMWNSSVLLAGLLAAPFTAVLGPIFSYNLLLTFAVATSGWCAFLAARRYVASPLPAVLGGLLYGFSPYMVAQSLGHLHLTLAFIPPLMLLLLDEILIRQRLSKVKMGVLLGLLATAQLLLAEELLATEVITAILGTAVLATLHPAMVRSHRRYALSALGVAAVVFVALSAVPLAIQFLGPERVSGPVQIRNTYVTDLLGFIVPTGQQLFAPAAAVRLTQDFSGYPPEWDAYLGLPLLAVLGYTTARFWRLPLVRVVSTLLLLLAVLSLGPTLHVAGHTTVLPVVVLALAAPLIRRVIPLRVTLYVFPATWVGLALAPVLSSVLPARLMLYVFLFAALLLAVFVQEVVKHSQASVRTALLVGLALLPLIPRIPFPSEPVAVPSFFTSGAAQQQIPDGSVALVLPYSCLASSKAMVWQAASNMQFRMPEGYALNPGPSFNAPVSLTGNLVRGLESGMEPPALTSELRSQVFADLTLWKVRTIIIGPMSHQDQAVAFFSALTNRAPKSGGGVFLWTFEGPSRPAAIHGTAFGLPPGLLGR